MTSVTRLFTIGLLAILLAGCGGAAATIAPDGTEPPPGATEAPPEGTEAPPAGTAPPLDPALPSFDPTAILQNLDGIDSYKITMANNDEVGYSAIVVTKPVVAKDISLGTGDDVQRIIVIGDEAWSGSGDTFTALPPELATAMLGAFDPLLIAGGFAQPGAFGGATDQGVEEHNGVQARHFHIDDATFAGAIAGVPPGASIDAWIAEDGGFLVGLEIVNGDGEGIVINVTDINDPANVVERPV